MELNHRHGEVERACSGALPAPSITAPKILTPRSHLTSPPSYREEQARQETLPATWNAFSTNLGCSPVCPRN